MTRHLKILLPLAFLLLPGCAPILIGGLIWDHIESREDCIELMADPNFHEKMKITEYERNFKKRCGADKDIETPDDGPQN